jgi:hypothetical protein
MGGLFSGPKMPSPAEVAPETTAAQARQEARLAEQEREQQARLAAQRRARQVGGQRMLLSQERENAQTGIQTTLGVG